MHRTDWSLVWLLVCSGTVMAFHIGKVPPALPALRAELGLSLEAAGWLISLTNLTGAAFGMGLALLSARLGFGRLIVSGAMLAAAASFAGAATGSIWLLFLCRFLEGVGFLLVTVSVPPLLLRIATAADLRLVLSIWSAYLPAGAGGIMIAAAVLLGDLRWQWLWYAAGFASLALAVSFFAFAHRSGGFASSGREQTLSLQSIGEVLRTPGVVLLGACFGLYAGSWYAVVGFLPVLQVERLGFSLATAALVNALVVFINVGGNVAAGWLLQRGVSRLSLLAGGALVMGSSAAGLFLDFLPDIVRLVLAFVYSAVGGVIPGSIFAGVPRHASRPALVGLATGLVMQLTNIGSLLGPPATGMLVTLGGWPAAMWWIGTAFALVIAAAMVLHRLESHPAPPADRRASG